MGRFARLVALGLCVAWLMAGCGKVDTGVDVVKGSLGKTIDRYLTRVTPFGFSGAVLVAKEGKIVLNKGYGMAIDGEGVPNSSETVFSVGSITKQFTAAAIMTLEMQGRLGTDDPISKYLKAVPDDKAGITLHHLLTHTSGLVRDVGGDYEVAHRDDTVMKILQQPLEFSPGERFEYTNVGYTLLAAIIETVSGMSYEEYLSAYLFRPSGMDYTGYRMPVWDDRVVAHWYVEGRDNGTALDKLYPYWNLIGNGGVLSTTLDMYRWHLALCGNDILSEEAKAKLYRTELNDYAYGWDVVDSPYGRLIQHDGGSRLGNAAEIRRYIDAEVVTIVFCNRDGEKVLFENGIRGQIEKLAFGEDVEVPPAVTVGTPDELKEFVGSYQMKSGGRLVVKLDDGALEVIAVGQDAIKLLAFPEGSDLGYLEELNRRSVEVFEAAVQGNYEPFGEVLRDREQRFDRVREFIDSRMANNQDLIGNIENVAAIGTMPSSYEEGAVQTMVALRASRGNLFFLSIWLGEENIGVAPLEAGRLFSMRFLPVSYDEFVGYHLGLGRSVRIVFKLTEDDEATGLVVLGEEAEVGLRKLAL
jgi:CubicO group peptidase (beta-lactamase class C family)